MSPRILALLPFVALLLRPAPAKGGPLGNSEGKEQSDPAVKMPGSQGAAPSGDPAGGRVQACGRKSRRLAAEAEALFRQAQSWDELALKEIKRAEAIEARGGANASFARRSRAKAKALSERSARLRNRAAELQERVRASCRAPAP